MDKQQHTQDIALELDDIQGTVLKERPTPYIGSYVLLRIDNAEDGRKFLQRLLPFMPSAAQWWDPTKPASLSVALTFQGLKALGVPQRSLESFPREFQQGMAARAEVIGDVGESHPSHWEAPFGTTNIHVALILFARDDASLQRLYQIAHTTLQDLPGVSLIYQLDFGLPPTGRTHFGYRDGIGMPLVAGSGSSGYPGQGPAIKAGEFILGYPDELGQMPPMPQPAELGRNGTYVAFRKLYEDVAAFRRFLRSNATTPEEQAYFAAKIVGRWPSGAPLLLAPERDDPELGADPQRNNHFLYQDDPKGLICPLGSHIRRANPRDAPNNLLLDVNLHRMIRRGAAYGPLLPEGVLEDDGIDRGIIFIFIGASLTRQFEFVLSQWMNDGKFIGLDEEKDIIAGSNDGTGTFTIPQRPIRRRIKDIHHFTVTKGGEYCFLPGLSALRWLSQNPSG